MISKTGKHAIRALITLGKLPPGRYAGAGQVAGQIQAPPNYLAKLLQSYVREGLVVSQKGLGGGFRLAKEPREITLFQILNPIEHFEQMNHCILGVAECNQDEPCRLHEDWKVMRDQLNHLLAKTTLAELIQDNKV